MDRIKKIKIKQQDGTMSDYYPIGADASNVDIDYNNSTLEVTMKKTPRYYENVASMKLDDTLQEGDMAITLGYYTMNDGGGAEYKIRVSSENYCEELENGLIAELILKDNKISFLQAGGQKDNSNAAIYNFQLLLKLLSYNKIIDFDNSKFFITDSISQEITNYILWENGELEYLGSNMGSLIPTTNIKIKLNNMRLINNASSDIGILIRYRVNPIECIFTNCYFEGKLSLIRQNILNNQFIEQNPIESFIFNDNYCYNIQATFINISDSTYKYAELLDNEIHNFKYTIFYDGTMNEYTYSSEISKNKQKLIVRNNYVHCDDNYWSDPESGSYLVFCLSECYEVFYEHNVVEGIKTHNNLTTGDVYLGAHLVHYHYNINKNNVVYDTSSSGLDANVLFKCKGGISDGDTLCTRYATHNQFILDPQYAAKINIPEIYMSRPILQATSRVNMYFTDNYIKTYGTCITQGGGDSHFVQLDFCNNTIITEQLRAGNATEMHSLFFGNDIDGIYKLHNNNIEVKDTTYFYNFLNPYTYKYLSAKDNILKGPIRYFLIPSTDYSPGEELIVKNNSIFRKW